jgi:hypothetical protein
MKEFTPYIISALALMFSVYQFVRHTEREDSGQITTVLVKLEHITELIADIKKDVREDRQDRKEIRDRLVAVEASAKSAHKRIDDIQQNKEMAS